MVDILYQLGELLLAVFIIAIVTGLIATVVFVWQVIIYLLKEQ